jgi:hypothetical protein
VRKGAPGLKATKIENKIGLRMVQNGDIVLNKVFVPDEDRLPGINSFQDISKVTRPTTLFRFCFCCAHLFFFFCFCFCFCRAKL